MRQQTKIMVCLSCEVHANRLLFKTQGIESKMKKESIPRLLLQHNPESRKLKGKRIPSRKFTNWACWKVLMQNILNHGTQC